MGKSRKPEEKSNDFTPRVKRSVIDHVTTQLNSAEVLFDKAEIHPNDVCQGDKIEIQKAIKAICAYLGIKVVFPLSRKNRGKPLTEEDLRGIGVKNLTNKKGS